MQSSGAEKLKKSRSSEVTKATLLGDKQCLHEDTSLVTVLLFEDSSGPVGVVGSSVCSGLFLLAMFILLVPGCFVENLRAMGTCMDSEQVYPTAVRKYPCLYQHFISAAY